MKYRAIATLNAYAYLEAIGLYMALSSEIGPSTPFREDVVRGLFRCYSRTGMHSECARLVVDTYLANKNLLLAMELRDWVHTLTTMPVVKQTAMCWSIAYTILQREGLMRRDPWSIYVLYDDFLASQAATRPSDLLGRCDAFDKSRLIVFLRYVCVPEVMDNSPFAFAGTKQLEEERIALCQALLRLDPANAECYSREIHELMRKGMIRESIQHVDKSKVYIDTSGIAKSLSGLCQERFDRCRALASLDGHLRKTPAVRDVLSKVFGDKDVVVWSDIGFETFVQLFDEIRRRYLFSTEYGLDSYISVRIRHGTLAGQIRSQFEAEHLITRVNAETGLYDSNKYWATVMCRLLSEEDWKYADSCLVQFSRNVDQTIDIVKKKWLHIKGEANNHEGLFDYDYTTDELSTLWGKLFAVDQVGSFDSFVEAVFAELHHRTRQNLALVRDRIRTDLKRRLIDAVNTLSGQTLALHSRLHYTQFNVAVTRCRTNIQNELETIAGWFENIEQATFPDFAFEHLVDTTTEMVKRCYPLHKFQLKIEIGNGFRCRGETFTSLNDMMFIILENVARHSDPDSTGIISAVIAAQVTDGYFQMTVSNPFSDSVDISQLRARVEQLRERPLSRVSDRFVRTEGGSGYYKLHKIIRHDLKCEDYDVSFRVSDTRVFTSQVRMQVRGVVL